MNSADRKPKIADASSGLKQAFAGVILCVLLLLSVTANSCAETKTSNAKMEAMTIPPAYPLWLVHVLAYAGDADAEAEIGFFTWQDDPCTAVRWLQAAARQDQLFAQWYLIAYYHAIASAGGPDTEENRLKAFLWYLHWQGHFSDPDESGKVATMLRLTPEQVASVKEHFKMWRPTDEPPLDLKACPGRKIEW